MTATLSPEAIVGILGPMAEETKRRTRAEGITTAADARKSLQAHIAAAPDWPKMQAEIDKAAAKIARAEASLAVARAERSEAQVAFNIASDQYTRESQRLRMLCFGPVERDAITRITREIESYQQSKESYAASAALPTLFECRNFLNGLAGANDPVDDVDALVSEAIATAARLFKEAGKELSVKIREEEKAARRRKIHSF